METKEFQSFVFLYTLYGGIIIGIAYDIYRVLRGTRKKEKLVTSLWDLTFLGFVLFVLIWTIFSSNYGELRAYVFIGFTVGFFLYEKILSRLAVAIFLHIKRSLIHFFKTTNSLLLLPFKFLFNLIWYPVSKLFSYIAKKAKKIKKIKKLPKAIISQNKKYFNLIIKKNKNKDKKDI